MNEDEHHIIELLNGLRELVYNHNDPQLRTDLSNFVLCGGH